MNDRQLGFGYAEVSKDKGPVEALAKSSKVMMRAEFIF